LRYINWRFKKRQQAFLAPLPGTSDFATFNFVLILLVTNT